MVGLDFVGVDCFEEFVDAILEVDIYECFIFYDFMNL